MRADEPVAEPVHRPDEAHDELVGGMLVEVARLADLLDLARVHQHHAVGDLHGLLLVVRDEDRRHVDVVVEAAQPCSQLLADAGVERTEGLVEQEDLRLDGERARERHTLPLTAGELGRVAVGKALQLHEREQLVHPGAHLAPSDACGW